MKLTKKIRSSSLPPYEDRAYTVGDAFHRSIGDWSCAPGRGALEELQSEFRDLKDIVGRLFDVMGEVLTEEELRYVFRVPIAVEESE